MKAILKSGRTVDLRKDCECHHHEGPHFIHIDALWKAMNQRLLANGNAHHNISMEAQRLRAIEKELGTRNLRIEEVVYERDDYS
jgi:hypothetical protein